jgi:hypothetical protein
MRLAHFQFDPETDRLGEGPLSEVYKAVDLQLGRTVALKVLRPHAEIDPQADTRFHREARHTSALEHPNITTIYEYGHDQGTSFIAMEYLRGRTLDKIIKDQSLGYEECLRIALQLTSALAVVHKHNLIHRVEARLQERHVQPRVRVVGDLLQREPRAARPRDAAEQHARAVLERLGRPPDAVGRTSKRVSARAASTAARPWPTSSCEATSRMAEL